MSLTFFIASSLRRAAVAGRRLAAGMRHAHQRRHQEAAHFDTQSTLQLGRLSSHMTKHGKCFPSTCGSSMDWPISATTGRGGGYCRSNTHAYRKFRRAGLGSHDGKASLRAREARHRVFIRRLSRRRRQVSRPQEIIRDEAGLSGRATSAANRLGVRLITRY